MKQCDSCRAGFHSRCTGDFTVETFCTCGFCKDWLDEHGPLADVPDTLMAVLSEEDDE